MGSGGLIAETIVRCTYNSFWSFLRINFVIVLPLWYWASLSGFLGDPDKRMYFGMLMMTGLMGLVISSTLRDVMLQLPPLNPQCDNSSYGGFNLVSFALTQFFTLALVHHLYLRIPVLSKLWSFGQLLFWLGLTWFVLVYTGQDSHWGFWFGGLAGIGVQLLFSLIFYGCILPRFPTLLHDRLAHWLCVRAIPAQHFLPDGWRLL
jgi:hypothetical protein